MRATSVPDLWTPCTRLVVAVMIALGIPGLPAQAATKFKLVAADAQGSDHFGEAVALDGETVVVGAKDKGQGAVYVFVKSQASWVQQAKLTGDSNVQSFGHSISIQGDDLIVGANKGHAYVFRRSGTTWSKQATLVPKANWNGLTPVAISGDHAVVALPLHGGGHVYHRSGAAWSKQAELASNCFGTVAIDGDYILGGCGGAPARVFRRFGSLWLSQATLTGSGDGHFGHSLAIRGPLAVVSEPFDSQVGAAVYLYRKNGPTWTPTKFNSPSPMLQHFGYSVSISSSYALAGMPRHAPDTGGAFLYRRNGASWSVSEVLASDVLNDYFGVAVAVSDTRAVVGAPLDGGLPEQGAAYVFEDLTSFRDLLYGILLGHQVPPLAIGCEIVDCCPGCPGPPYEIDWRIRLSGPVLEAVHLWFPTLPPDAPRRMNVQGNGRWLGLNRLRVGRGETILRGFSVNPGVRAPVAIPQLVLDDAAVRRLTSDRGVNKVGRIELIVEQMVGRTVVGEYRFDYDIDEALRAPRASAPKP